MSRRDDIAEHDREVVAKALREVVDANELWTEYSVHEAGELVPAKEEAALRGMSFSAFVRTYMIEELAKKGQ